MVIPAVMLVILALVVMRALMSVVAHEETALPEQAITLEPTMPRTAIPRTAAAGTPVRELRARADDGVRSLLMPAAEPEIGAEPESTADRTRTTSS